MNSQTNKNNYAGFNPVFGHYVLAPFDRVGYGNAFGTLVPTSQLGNTDKVVVSFDTETESVTRIIPAWHLRAIRDGQTDSSIRVRMNSDKDESGRSRKGKKADREEIRVEVIQRAKKPLRG